MKAYIITDEDGNSAWNIDLEVPTLSDADAKGLAWALAGAKAANQRVSSSITAAFPYWAAAVEVVLWAHAVDDVLDGMFGKAYRLIRSEDPHGRMMAASRWLRNVHAHDLVRVTARGSAINVRDLGDRRIKIWGPDFTWRHADDIKAEKETSPSRQDQRDLYNKSVAEQPVTDVLVDVLRWIDKVIEASGYKLPDPNDDVM